MKSYFFIPATRLHKLEQIAASGVHEIIIDLEDAVTDAQRPALIQQLSQLPDRWKSCWLRIPLRANWSDQPDWSIARQLLKMGFHRLVLPKLNSADEWNEFLVQTLAPEEFRGILLIEHPRLLIDLHKILEGIHADKIEGVGLGSHDLMNFIGAQHEPEQLRFPRIQCLYLAKSFGKYAIDIASMNLSDEESFAEEVRDGFRHGYDAKFVIHPAQWQWMQKALEVQPDELRWARKVIAALPKNTVGKDAEPFVLEGEIIEKPHIEKAMNILKKHNDGK